MPETKISINPYLAFDGRCEEAFKFYERHLGGKILMMLAHEGTPAENSVAPEWKKKIMHARMQLGNSLLMGSDMPPNCYRAAQGTTINISVDDAQEAERLFAALAERGRVTMPIAETFWAMRFGALVDQFGIPWMINCERAQQEAALEQVSQAATAAH